jgi:hypothetical protein
MLQDQASPGTRPFKQDPINGNGTLGWAEQPRKQMEQRGLSGPGCAHD